MFTQGSGFIRVLERSKEYRVIRSESACVQRSPGTIAATERLMEIEAIPLEKMCNDKLSSKIDNGFISPNIEIKDVKLAEITDQFVLKQLCLRDKL